jgi:hypothetical protein
VLGLAPPRGFTKLPVGELIRTRTDRITPPFIGARDCMGGVVLELMS